MSAYEAYRDKALACAVAAESMRNAAEREGMLQLAQDFLLLADYAAARRDAVGAWECSLIARQPGAGTGVQSR